MHVNVIDTDLVPERKHPTDAGLDLKSARTFCLVPGERFLVSTGVSIDAAPGCYVQLAERSGLAVRHGIGILGGVIDEGYTGEIMVCLINHGDDPVYIRRGDRICQAIELTLSQEQDVFVNLDGEPINPNGSDEVRVGAGFGSTGR